MAEDKTTPTTEQATEAVTTAEAPKAPVAKRKKGKRNVPYGIMNVYSTFNNTIVTFSDKSGGVLTQSSAGACGFRGSKKGTAYAAQIAAEKAGAAAKQNHGLSKVDVVVKGIGQGRDTAVRALINLDISVESIKDVTTIAHGGVRPRKAKRN
jgi:small subunit ribosomal protein S11